MFDAQKRRQEAAKARLAELGRSRGSTDSAGQILETGLGVIGGIVGGVFGGPAGAAAGYSAGTGVGRGVRVLGDDPALKEGEDDAGAAIGQAAKGIGGVVASVPASSSAASGAAGAGAGLSDMGAGIGAGVTAAPPPEGDLSSFDALRRTYDGFRRGGRGLS